MFASIYSGESSRILFDVEHAENILLKLNLENEVKKTIILQLEFRCLTVRQIRRQTNGHTDRHTYITTDRQTDRQTNRQTVKRDRERQTDGRRTERQTDRWTDGWTVDGRTTGLIDRRT